MPVRLTDTASRFALLLFVVACQETTTVVMKEADSLLLAQPKDSMDVGESIQLIARVIDRDGFHLPDAPVTWQSSRPDIATVTASGLVTGVIPGSVTITARSGRATRSRILKVLSPVVGLDLAPGQLQLDLHDDPVRISADALDASGTVIPGRRPSWRSSDPAVAIVIDGVVTPMGIGDALVIATLGTLEDTVRVHVELLPATSLSLSPGTVFVITGGKGLVTADVVRGDGSVLRQRGVIWSTGDPGIAVVNASGIVTGIAPGTTTIIATTDNGLSETTNIRVVPADGVPRVANGSDHSCAIPVDGRLMCWGSGLWGQIGYVEPTTFCFEYYYYYNAYRCTPIPNEVLPSARFHAVVAGSLHTCALDTGGKPYCWGYGWRGQLGTGTNEPMLQPRAVSTSAVLTMLTAGQDHTCGLTVDGSALCWGSNLHGQLGSGGGSFELEPVSVAGGHTFIDIAAGDTHTCGIRVDQALLCWGNNRMGQVATGLSDDVLLPASVHGLQVTRVAGGLAHTCAVTTASALVCWGAGTGMGEVGAGKAEGSADPVPALATATWIGVSARGASTCGVTDSFSVLCWGLNSAGILGNGRFDGVQFLPTLVNASEQFTHVSLGAHHACGFTRLGSTACWGTGFSGEMGTAASHRSGTPVVIVP